VVAVVDAELTGGITPDFFTAVALGMVPNHTAGTRLGTNDVIPQAAFILLSNVTSVTSVGNLPSAAQQMQVVSTSASDTAAGTGAQQVEITYLTTPAAGFQKKTEIVTLNGITPVLTTNTDIFRIDRFRVSRAGLMVTALGNVSLQSVGGAATFEIIPALTNVFRSAIHWVPKGFKTNVPYRSFGVTTTGGVTFILEAFEEDASGNVVVTGNDQFDLGQGVLAGQLIPPLVVSNPNGKMIGVAIVIRGRASNQAASGSFRFVDSPL